MLFSSVCECVCVRVVILLRTILYSFIFEKFTHYMLFYRAVPLAFTCFVCLFDRLFDRLFIFFFLF